jgi:serine/threonine protein kinase
VALATERRYYESEQCTTATAEPMLRPNGSVDWRAFCETLNPDARGKYPDTVYDLLNACLQLDPAKRISAWSAHQHPFLALDHSLLLGA